MPDSYVRRVKRRAMREHGLTYTQRLRRSLVSRQPIKPVRFEVEGKTVVAKEAD